MSSPSATEKGADASTSHPSTRCNERLVWIPSSAFVFPVAETDRKAIVQLSFQLAGGQGYGPRLFVKIWIEMLHAGSLGAIDTFQDDSQLRRACPTIAPKWRAAGDQRGQLMYFEALDQVDGF